MTAVAAVALLCVGGAAAMTRAADGGRGTMRLFANPSADLDQCANDPAPSPSTNGCSSSAADWVNGNLGASKSVYFEGDSIPYRLRFDNLTLASHQVTIEWDTTKGGTHALDYLTTFNQSVADANPCLGVSGCGSPTTFPIPADGQVTGAGVTPTAGNFTLYGGTITAVGAYSGGAGFPAGDNSRRITITFTPTVANPVLAWGGHIATRSDWGMTAAAVSIPGSPYHTRLIDLDGSGGNQDRSLSADAVIFPGSITIVKDATPNGPTSFPFTASPAPLSDFSLTDDGTSANTHVFSNITDFKSYSVAETVPSFWTLTGAACSVTSPNGGSWTFTSPSVAIDMKEGENFTCTFNDRQQTGTLRVIKQVVNDNGGTKTAADFSMHVKSGGSDVAGSPQAGSTTGTVYTLPANTSYAVSEDAVAGYTQTSASADCTGTIAAGTEKTCTITNDDQAGTLIVKKLVINDNGGSKVATDFSFKVNGGSATAFSQDGADTLKGKNTLSVSAGSYSVTEDGTPIAGYTTSYDNCSNVAVANGATQTCTITNDDRTPALHLVKVVVNDNAGTKTVADFPLTATGPTSLGPAASPVDSGAGFKAGSYTLSETTDPSYTASAWSCDKAGSLSGNVVTVGLGDDITCTITNDDKAQGLHLRKVVVNDNGGTARATDWTLAADGPTPLSGSTPVDSGANFKPGTYTLSETGGPDGYTASAWVCDGGTQDGSSITVADGESATCTITNDDNAPGLHLRKVVVDDNGGTAAATDWTLAAAGPSPLSGTTPVDSGAGFKAGTYTLSETGGPDGYAASAWACDGGSQAGASVTLALGESATCTITNDDIGPTITIQKRLLPANDGGTFDFSVDQGEQTTTLDDGGKGYGNLGSTGPVTINTGSATIGETGHGSTKTSDYASTWSCSTDASGNGTSIRLSGLSLGQNVTCTFTNTRLATLVVKKVVDNSNGGGSKAPGDFTLHVTQGGIDITGSPAAGSGSGTTYSGLLPGTYRVTESSVSGYSLTSIAGCLADGSIVLEAGQTATCTLTNTSAAPPPPPPPPPPAPKIDLSITKSGSPSPQTVGLKITWTMVVTNNGRNNATGVTVADPIPAGTTYVSSSSSQGTCTGGVALSCQIGSLAVGNSVTITLVTTANATGTIPNTATVVGSEAETNTANNTASASVQVIGKFTPPPVYCTALAVAPKQLYVGKKNVLRIKVTQHGKATKGVRIRIKGSTISVLTQASDRKGLVRRTVKPMKAGIVTFTPVASKRCNAPRVGVIGVFTPPVTG